MAASTESQAQPAARVAHLPLVLAALIFAGFNLRTVLLEVPPILPLIAHDLRLTHTATGFLNALPPLLLGLLAYPAARIIGRIGARMAMTIALAVMALTALLRALTPNAPMLFVVTGLLSVAIALGQTSVPMAVNDWFGRHIGQTTAAYSTGLMVGEIVAAAFTAPLILQTVAQGNWRGTFIFWSVPVVASLVLWLVYAPHNQRHAVAVDLDIGAGHVLAPDSAPGALVASGAAAPRLTPWRILHASLLLGGGSLIFFGMDTWIPVYYAHLHRTDGTLALTVLTVAQLPPSLALTAWGQHFAGKRLGFVIAGTVATVTMVLWFIVPIGWDLALIAVMGAMSAMIFILGLSLPSLLATGKDVAQISGIMLGISYTMAFAGPFLGGVLWDNTHNPITAFVPILLGSVVVLVLGASMAETGRTGHGVHGSG